MVDVTPELLADITALAQAATPGPWANAEGYSVFSGTPPDHIWVCAMIAGRPSPEDLANAAYIAAADPQTVLALVAEIARLREHDTPHVGCNCHFNIKRKQSWVQVSEEPCPNPAHSVVPIVEGKRPA